MTHILDKNVQKHHPQYYNTLIEQPCVVKIIMAVIVETNCELSKKAQESLKNSAKKCGHNYLNPIAMSVQNNFLKHEMTYCKDMIKFTRI